MKSDRLQSCPALRRKGPIRHAAYGFLLLAFAVVSSRPLQGADFTATAPLPTSASQQYPQVSCTTSDVTASADILQIAADVRDQLTPLLQLGSNWRFPVNIHIIAPEDPLTGKAHHESVSVVVADGTLKIWAFLPSNDPNAREFIQRQFVTALLWEKFFPKKQAFDTQTRLDIVPTWLIEGLREWLNDDPEHDRASIVRRAAQIQLAPTLDEITSWREVSDDRLLGLWQRAFCYYLVNSLIGTPATAQRENFQQWLTSVSGPNPTSAKYLFPTETGWQRELIEATDRSHDIVYTWDETADELATMEKIVILAAKPADIQMCTFDTVQTFPRDAKLLAVLQQKRTDLTGLELRAHPSWRPIIALYRFGITALVNDPRNDQAAQATKFFEEAKRRRALEMDYHQKLVDYVNWFEVTKNYAGDTSYFHSYFTTAQAMERVQADPAHPNPIRVGLLHVESQL